MQKKVILVLNRNNEPVSEQMLHHEPECNEILKDYVDKNFYSVEKIPSDWSELVIVSFGRPVFPEIYVIAETLSCNGLVINHLIKNDGL